MEELVPHSDETIRLFKNGRKLVYKKGQIILRAQEEPAGVYYIESGFVKIYSLSREADEHYHLLYTTGNIFPVIWAFRNAIRNVYYVAAETTTLWIISKQTFLTYVQKNPDVALTLINQLTDLFRLYVGRIDNLLYSNSYDKVAYRLLSLVNSFGTNEEGKLTIAAPVTHQDIDNSISLSREMTSRSMERMQRNGILSYDKKHHIVIDDLKKLIDIIGEDTIEGMWPSIYKMVN